MMAEGRREDRISWTSIEGRRLDDPLSDLEWKLSDGWSSSGLALMVTWSWPRLLAEPFRSRVLVGVSDGFALSSPSVSLASSPSDNRPSRVALISLLNGRPNKTNYTHNVLGTSTSALYALLMRTEFNGAFIEYGLIYTFPIRIRSR